MVPRTTDNRGNVRADPIPVAAADVGPIPSIDHIAVSPADVADIVITSDIVILPIPDPRGKGTILDLIVPTGDDGGESRRIDEVPFACADEAPEAESGVVSAAGNRSVKVLDVVVDATTDQATTSGDMIPRAADHRGMVARDAVTGATTDKRVVLRNDMRAATVDSGVVGTTVDAVSESTPDDVEVCRVTNHIFPSADHHRVVGIVSHRISVPPADKAQNRAPTDSILESTDQSSPTGTGVDQVCLARSHEGAEAVGCIPCTTGNRCVVVEGKVLVAAADEGAGTTRMVPCAAADGRRAAIDQVIDTATDKDTGGVAVDHISRSPGDDRVLGVLSNLVVEATTDRRKESPRKERVGSAAGNRSCLRACVDRVLIAAADHADR